MTDERTVTGRLVGDTRPAVDSSSILLLRDHARGSGGESPSSDSALEVFMLERHVDSDFAGGAYAFPGGKLDDADRRLPAARWTGIDPAALRAPLGADSDADALGLCVAAVREAFEEAGVLLATREGGAALTGNDLASPGFVAARAELAARNREGDWAGWLAAEALVLDLGALAFWSWWATPDGLHKRYNTRFFLAVVPPAQIAALGHDDVETTASRWTTPAGALADQRAGRAVIVYPTRQNLDALAGYATASEAWEAAHGGRSDRRRLQPRIVRVGGRAMVVHPDGGDPERP